MREKKRISVSMENVVRRNPLCMITWFQQNVFKIIRQFFPYFNHRFIFSVGRKSRQNLIFLICCQNKTFQNSLLVVVRRIRTTFLNTKFEKRNVIFCLKLNISHVKIGLQNSSKARQNLKYPQPAGSFS